MAHPADFPEANFTLKPAPGTEDEVSPLRAHFSKEVGMITSCWKLTPEELEVVKQTGVVWLHVYGKTSYPVAIQGFDPFKPVPDAG